MKTRSPTPACFANGARLAAPAAALGVALALSGCAIHHEVRVDALTRPRAEAVSYVFKASGPLAEADSLRAQELAAQMRTALARRGMYEAAPNAPADLTVELECGMNSLPARPKRIPGPLDRPEPWVIPSERVLAGIDDNGQPVYVHREILKTPGGYYEMVRIYEKYLRVSAHENVPPADARPPAEVWRVDATLESESDDLRKALPILVTATIEQIGSDSHGQKTVRVKETKPGADETRRSL